MEPQDKDKKSFILYTDFYPPIEDLTDEQMGKLFRAIFLYQCDGITEVDPEIKMAFGFFLNQFKIDHKKYLSKCQKNSENIQKFWDKRKNTTEYERIRPNTNATDNDNDNDNENENENENGSGSDKSHDPAIFLKILKDTWKEIYMQKHSVSYTFHERDKKELIGIAEQLISDFKHNQIEITNEKMAERFKEILTKHGDPYRDDPKNCRPSIFNNQFSEIMATIKNPELRPNADAYKKANREAFGGLVQ